jgi:hypothetical protein
VFGAGDGWRGQYLQCSTYSRGLDCINNTYTCYAILSYSIIASPYTSSYLLVPIHKPQATSAEMESENQRAGDWRLEEALEGVCLLTL